jgi:hypothetical protein
MAGAPESYGYPGSVNAAVLADWLTRVAGARFSVGGKDDWKVSVQGNLDRGIRINGGIGVGDSVMDVFPDYETLSLPAVASGSQWFLIARRRNWSTPATTNSVVIPGTAERKLPNRSDSPGQESDQALALVRVQAGDTVVKEIIDLRAWAGSGGVEAADILGREQLARPGAAVKIGSDMHRYEYTPANGGAFAWKVYPLRGGSLNYSQQSFSPTTWSAGTEVGVAVLNIPDPGVPYRVKAVTGTNIFADDAAGIEVRVRLDTITGAVLGAVGNRPAGTADGLGLTVVAGIGGISAERTGSTTVIVTVRRVYGSGAWAVAAGGNALGVELILS